MESEKRRVLVVGGGYGGVACATRLARKTRGTGTRVVLVDARPHFVERVRLHEDVSGAMRRRIPFSEHVARRGVDVIVGTVEEIDFDRRRARIGRSDEPFDALVLATGSTGSAPKYSLSIATEEEAIAARAHLDQSRVRRIVTCGGGLTGVELTAEIVERRRGLDVTLVTSGELLPSFAPEARSHARRWLADRGVNVCEHAHVAAVESDGVVLASGEALPSDATLWAGGFRASRLAADVGLPVDSSGRALVDARLRSTAHPFVHVVGDMASTGLRMSCAVALPTGCFAADDLVREMRHDDPEPFSFGFAVTCVSLGRRNGVIQKTDAEGRPERIRLDGLSAAWFKELICRFAMASTNESWGFEYRWPHGRSEPRASLPSGTSAPLRHRLPNAR